MPWQKNNRAATTLYSTFLKLDQLNLVFSKSGSLKMSELQYFNPAASPEQLDTEIKMLADITDKIFIVGRSAQYEEGIDKTQAMAAMVTVLRDEDKTMEELGDVVDELYLFWNE